MGLSFFAMGNSLGDLVTNTSIARMGFSKMALGACLGTPLLSKKKNKIKKKNFNKY